MRIPDVFVASKASTARSDRSGAVKEAIVNSENEAKEAGGREETATTISCSRAAPARHDYTMVVHCSMTEEESVEEQSTLLFVPGIPCIISWMGESVPAVQFDLLAASKCIYPQKRGMPAWKKPHHLTVMRDQDIVFQSCAITTWTSKAKSLKTDLRTKYRVHVPC
jgi:hypothetical protein